MNATGIFPHSHPRVNTLNTLPHTPQILNKSAAAEPESNHIGLLKDIAGVVFSDDAADKIFKMPEAISLHIEAEPKPLVRDSASAMAHRQLSQLYSQPPLDDDQSKEIIAQQKNITKLTADVIEHTDNQRRNQRLQSKNFQEQLSARIKRAAGQEERGEITIASSYAELWARLALAIAAMKKDYVDFYADLMHQYTKMYESFNENVQKASSEAISTGDDGNNVKFDKKIMQTGYDVFDKDVAQLNNILSKVKNWDEMSDEAKKNLTVTLEPAFKLNEKGEINFNLDQYNTVKGSHPSGIDNNGKVSTASYQAWLATFNAAGNDFQSNMQSFAQRYSQASSTFDNINKVLSGSISSLAESAKDILKSL